MRKTSNFFSFFLRKNKHAHLAVRNNENEKELESRGHEAGRGRDAVCTHKNVSVHCPSKKAKQSRTQIFR